MNASPPTTVWFCNRWAGFQGGAEQHIYDVALGLRDQGIRCELLYNTAGQQFATFTQAFASSHRIDFTNIATWPTVFPLAPTHVYYHNWPLQHLHPALPRTIQTWYMVHDSSLFCPRSHMYHAWSGKTCTQPLSSDCSIQCRWLSHPLYWTSPKLLRQRLKNLHTVDQVVCGSSYLANMLQSLGIPESKLLTIPLARSIATPAEIVPKTNKAVPEIVFVGSIIRSKGIDLLLQALTHVEATFVCRIVGQGKQIDRFRKLARKLGFGRGERQHQTIVFEGWKSQEELRQLYQNASLVVVPSRTPETFGLVGLEAMSSGLPVVAFDVGGISEWLQHQHNGFLIPSQDCHKMGHSIEQLLLNPELAQRMGQNGLTSLQANFTFPSYIQRLSQALALQ